MSKKEEHRVNEHTPGPWDLRDHGIYQAGRNRQIAEIIAHAGDDTLNDEDKANACLIIAAHDLLAACKAALEVIMSAEATIYGEWGCPLPEYDSVAEQLRDAIALATNSGPAEGREP